MTTLLVSKRRGMPPVLPLLYSARLFVCIFFFFLPFHSYAADHVFIIVGKGGQPAFSEKYAQLARQLHDILITKHGFSSSQVTVLIESSAKLPMAAAPCTADNIRTAFERLAGALQPRDLVAVILFGHGTYDGDWAKFNLEGPDWRDLDWAQTLDRLPTQHQVFINTTAASGPFIEKLSKPNRVVITATRSGEEKYATVFPEYFVEAFLKPEEADLDKNNSVSLLEAFDFSRDRLVRFYENANRLRPEHPLLDDNGDGSGSETPTANSQTVADGQLASRTFLAASAASAAPTTTAERSHPLAIEKARLLAEIENLKARKNDLPATEYNRKIEELFIRLAKLNRQIRESTAR
ncbi:MAG: hypothetical protein ONB46_07730 [candidate division KSB1 bacterium]|nr:hypothetical protein [candidate division KSB1 bacterium]MDZ7365501.1 hypothetical protein [candidate division KSB1 bacterium]MDZ7403604.1 hypothetical protein [candidate division KSB1 bacterium]